MSGAPRDDVLATKDSDAASLATIQEMAKHLGMPVPKTLEEAMVRKDELRAGLEKAIDQHNKNMKAGSGKQDANVTGK